MTENNGAICDMSVHPDHTGCERDGAAMKLNPHSASPASVTSGWCYAASAGDAGPGLTQLSIFVEKSHAETGQSSNRPPVPQEGTADSSPGGRLWRALPAWRSERWAGQASQKAHKMAVIWSNGAEDFYFYCSKLELTYF